MRKNKKAPYSSVPSKQMSVREASDFWDKHSFLEFDDVQEVNIEVDIEGEKHYVLLDSDVAKRIESLARKKRQRQHLLVNKLLKKSLERVAD